MDINSLDPVVSPWLTSGLWIAAVLTGLLLLRKYLGNIIEVFTNPYKSEEEFWSSLLTGNKPGVPMYFMRDFFTLFKCERRCKVCNMPFDGISSMLFKFLWSGQSNLTPNFCKKCEDFAKRHLGGAEISMTMLFVDMRDSTETGEKMQPKEFRDLLNRFYSVTTDALTDNGAWIDKFVGDEAIGLFIPGFAGEDHAYLAAKSALELLEATGHYSEDGPWIPLGVGINTGNAFLGTVGSGKVIDITALGDEVNLTARLCSMAKAGEIVFSESTYNTVLASKENHSAFFRELGSAPSTMELKGKSGLQNVYITKVNPGKPFFH